MHHHQKHRGDPKPQLPTKAHRVKVVIASLGHPVDSRYDVPSPSRIIHKPQIIIHNISVLEPIHGRPTPLHPPELHRRAATCYIPSSLKPLNSGPRRVVPIHLPHRHVRIELPARMSKRKVHFDLWPQTNEPRHVERRSSNEDARRPLPPALRPIRSDALPRMPPAHGLGPQSPDPDLHHQPFHHQQGIPYRHVPLSRPNPTPPAKSIRPTIHILTYALDRTPHKVDAYALRSRYLPPETSHLYTILAHKFTPPPEGLCRLYSGVNPILQEYVMSDPRARRAVRHAVQDLLDFWRQEQRREKDGRSWKKNLAISVCCYLGTHRSVGVAEKIRQELEETVGARGPAIRVVHVHRRRGLRDPW